MAQKQTLYCLFLVSFLAINNCYAADGESSWSRRLTLRNVEGNGVGYNQGYTTLEGFLAPSEPWNERWVPFLDLRAHIFNNGKSAANAGGGLRYLASRVWGGNFYYDYRKTSHQHYNQVSFGLESLGTQWDFRLNGYFPVGDKKSSQLGGASFVKFNQHHMYILTRYEFAMTGANAEVGARVTPWKHFPLYFAAGPYYLTGQGKIAWGGEARVALDIFDYVKLEGKTSYDSVFRWTGQGQLGMVIPLGPRKKAPRPTTALQRVYRNEIIPVNKRRKHSKAINPTTGQPYLFWFVDNTSHSAGTFESPFTTLVDAQNASSPSDVIYVFPGNGTSSGMDVGIMLKDNQSLLGAGQNQSLLTTRGTVIIPAMATSLPLITNGAISGGGDVVVCLSNNEVSGLNLQNINPATPTSACINIIGSNATITSNTLMAYKSSNAISFVNNTTKFGSVAILNNIIAGGDTTDTFGIDITTTHTQSGTFTIQNNLFTGNDSASGLDQGISLLNGNTISNGTVTLSILNNIFNSQTNAAINYPTDPPAGIYCEINPGSTQALALFINENQISIPSGIVNPLAGINITQNNGILSTVLLKITNNTSDTPPGVPGYRFIRNIYNSSLMQLYFSHNAGTTAGP